MDLPLPPLQRIPLFSTKENGWSDNYGAIRVAAAYAGLACPPRYVIQGLWQHGCFGPWYNTSPSTLVYSTPGAQQRPVLVAREDQAGVLRQAGFADVRAIGLPILYTPAPTVAREPGSLLVVPTHSLIGEQHPDRRPFERYADLVAGAARHFRKVTVCVHPNCAKNGLWVKEFTARGLEIIYGAEVNDANALARMRLLFAAYETVTTNDWGSHVAYALAFGARVSIHGEPVVSDWRTYLSDATWAANAQALEHSYSTEILGKKRECLRQLYVEPAAAVADDSLGRGLIGGAHQLDPAAMAGLLQTLVSPAPRLPVRPVTVAGPAARRVLFVSHEASRTGAPMYLLHLLRWLRAHTDVHLEVLLAKGGPLESVFAGIAPVRTPAEFEADPSALARFDLVYANTIYCAELIERLGGGRQRIITHLHELDSGYHWAGARAMGRLIRHSDRFIACATRVAERFGEVFGVPAADISVHHEMVDAPALAGTASRRDEAALRAQYGLPADALVVAGCGTLDLRKGADLFVQVAAQLARTAPAGRPVRFLWIGAMPSRGTQAALAEDVRKLGLTGTVVFTGELAEPHPLLSLCDVFCLTSREDPFPLAMLEAAALGKPVVCFDGAGGGREFCELGGGVTVPYLDVAALAAACRGLLADAAGRAAVGARAAALVKERFTVEVIAPAVWDTMQAVMGAAAGTGEQLADVFARWTAAAPQPAYVAAHLARVQVRRQAAQLTGAGRAREAVQLLVKAVNADLATKDPLIICESLVQIGEDLAAYDAKQSAVLLDRAAAVARSARLDLDGLRGRAAA